MDSQCEFVEVCVTVPQAYANTFKKFALLLCSEQQDADVSGWVTQPPMSKATRPGRMLKGMRLRAGMTQLELAKKIQVPQTHISQYERNVRKVPVQKAKLLAVCLETSEDYFLS
ncbi:helix-turn-helix transcriptional regulator [Desulfovibrio sp.]|uniref:helix-turn-helix domain-containing protein n=1 Tax=Desulfovibrio sp. TaxID=885 RepID=UPI0025C6A178|nr:helix-turn-helix transcriptional regulator [Desulfovibrio sp.]